MKTSSYFQGKVKENFEKFFNKGAIDSLSKASEFVLRKDAKITAFSFVVGFIESCYTRSNTYSSWASAIGFFGGEEVSKQPCLNE